MDNEQSVWVVSTCPSKCVVFAMFLVAVSQDKSSKLLLEEFYRDSSCPSSIGVVNMGKIR